MKKIVFVEKEDSSAYDPVSTFFAKKAQLPQAKTSNNETSSKPPSSKNAGKPMPSRTSVTKPTPFEKRELEKEKEKQKAVTGKIGRKGDYIAPKRTSESSKREESIYNNSRNKKIETIQETDQMSVEFQSPGELGHTSNSNLKLEPINKSQPKVCQEASGLKRRIKELEANEIQYKLRLQELEQKEEKFFKNEQKLAKLQKQHKLCGTQTKELMKKLKEKQEEVKKLYSKDDIPYSKRREILFLNQLATLKKTNRELVARIKNYRGTDLVEIALLHNKSDILNEFDNGSGEEKPDLSKLQSLAFRLLQQINRYMGEKGSSSHEMPWLEEKKVLNELCGLAKDISLECLQNDLKVPLISAEQSPINLYDQIDRYRGRLEPVLSKHDLNLKITEQNIQLINSQHESSEQILENKKLAIKVWQESPRKFKKPSEASAFYLTKMKEVLNVYEGRYISQNVILAHCFAQLAYVQEWVGKSTQGLREELRRLSGRLREVEEIVRLGEGGKESLLVYMSENVGDLVMKVPNLELQVKEMGWIFRRRRQRK